MNFLKEPMLARETVRRPSAFFGSTELVAVLKEVGPIGCLDIGARGGVVEDISPLGQAAFVYGFEPDEEECARLNRTVDTGGHPFGELRFLPAALGPREERRTLNIMRHSGASSILLPDRDITARFPPHQAYYDVTHTVPIDTVPLDRVIDEHGIVNPVYMKIDVEGFELEILKGADELMSSSLLALRSEVAFLPTRLGQPDFADIAAHLKPFGFMPMGFLYLATWRSLTNVKHPRLVDGPVPYSHGQLVHGDVLFLRDPAVLDDRGVDGVEAQIRLAFLALLYDYVDFAHGIFTRPAVSRHLVETVGSDGLAGLKTASIYAAKRHKRRTAGRKGNPVERITRKLRKRVFAR